MLPCALKARVIYRTALKFEVTFRRFPCVRNYKHLLREFPKHERSSRIIDVCAKHGSLKIHTTRKLDIPPVLAVIIRPLINVGAFLFGRYFKRWWAKQSPAQKEAYKKWLASKKGVIFGILGSIFVGSGVFYFNRLETNPFTNRQRFIMFNDKQQALFAKLIYEMNIEEQKNNFVSHNHPAYLRILKVTKKLLNANKDLPFVADGSWTLNVVNEDIGNAYVLPGGHIFVFLGLLRLIDNDEQLAIVLAHEISHILLKHSLEQFSNKVILDLLLAIPLAVLWAIFPDLVAFLTQMIAKNLLKIILELPYSRALEKEADEMGLTLAAKACIDVREAVVFWATMKALVEMNFLPDTLPWLSTHPENEERENFLNDRITEALSLREKSGCWRVPRTDPRDRFNKMSSKEREMLFKARGFMLNPNRE